MAQFEPVKNELKRAGASLLFIAAEKRAGFFKPEKFLSENPVSFPFLLDEDRAVTKAYGVYHRIGLDAYNIARPATFVLDRSGTIQFAYIGSSQTDRAPVTDVLKALNTSDRPSEA
jgi:peroxiredoxin